MKRIAAVLGLALALLLVAGCGNTDDSTPANTSGDEILEVDEEDLAEPDDGNGDEDGAGSSSASGIAPADYLANNPEGDIIVYNGETYVNAERVSWVEELHLDHSDEIGTVARSGVSENFTDWDATVLPEGTEIRQHGEEDDVLVAVVGDEYVPYLRYVG